VVRAPSLMSVGEHCDVKRQPLAFIPFINNYKKLLQTSGFTSFSSSPSTAFFRILIFAKSPRSFVQKQID